MNYYFRYLNTPCLTFSSIDKEKTLYFNPSGLLKDIEKERKNVHLLFLTISHVYQSREKKMIFLQSIMRKPIYFVNMITHIGFHAFLRVK